MTPRISIAATTGLLDVITDAGGNLKQIGAAFENVRALSHSSQRGGQMVHHRPSVRFGCATNALVVDREFLERHVPAADPRLYKILRRYLDQVLAEMPRQDNFRASMRKEGDPKLAPVAKRLARSPRTLQRRISEHGFNFKELTDDTRRRFAMKYLKDRKHTLTPIAFLLGDSEVSAFKRWTRSTPMKYRKESRS